MRSQAWVLAQEAARMRLPFTGMGNTESGSHRGRGEDQGFHLDALDLTPAPTIRKCGQKGTHSRGQVRTKGIMSVARRGSFNPCAGRDSPL